MIFSPRLFRAILMPFCFRIFLYHAPDRGPAARRAFLSAAGGRHARFSMPERSRKKIKKKG